MILAGNVADQSPEGRQRRSQVWDGLARASLPALYALGNHEVHADCVPRDVLRRRLEAELPANVRVLDRDSVELGGPRFLGCTLWTKFSLGGSTQSSSQADDRTMIMREAEVSISDFKYLFSEGGPLNEQGIVYTLRENGPPKVLGELAADNPPGTTSLAFSPRVVEESVRLTFLAHRGTMLRPFWLVLGLSPMVPIADHHLAVSNDTPSPKNQTAVPAGNP